MFPPINFILSFLVCSDFQNILCFYFHDFKVYLTNHYYNKKYTNNTNYLNNNIT